MSGGADRSYGPAARIKPKALATEDTAERVSLPGHSIVQTHGGSQRAKTAAGSAQLQWVGEWAGITSMRFNTTNHISLGCT